MALRTRLLLTLVAVVAFGLIVSDVATYTSLRSFLVGRVDPQLDLASVPVSREVLISAGIIHVPTHTTPSGGATAGPAPSGFSTTGRFAGVPRTLRSLFFGNGRGGRSALEPAGTIGELLNGSGKMVGSPVTFSYSAKAGTPPVLPHIPGSSTPGANRFFDETSVGAHATSYRVLERALGYHDLSIVVAIPLTDVNQTLNRLLLIELLATAALLVGLGLLARWIVRRGLRPLEDMAVTAGDIARGDLARRVEPDGGPTEVGRLGGALNVMLGEIQEAFDSRAASEARLRRFVADASHELRTPLTSLRGYAELFEHNSAERPPEDLATAMRHIRREADRMSVLVDDLLVLANLDQVRPLHTTSVDLAAVVREAVVALRFTGNDHTVRFHGGPLTVECDAERVRRAVDNLLTNAVRYSPAGSSIDVTVRARPDLGPAATANGHGALVPGVPSAEIEIRDEGPGVPSDEADRIFEPFYRADTSRTRITGGTGLGLAIVAAIVEAHHGTLGVRPNSPVGSCFWLRLPLRQGETEPTAVPVGETGKAIAAAPGDEADGSPSKPTEPAELASTPTRR